MPDRLKNNWELILGKSQDKLPELLERLGEIDFFLHDSEHSYECQKFEYELAYKHLRKGGILMSDDINQSSAWKEFCADKKVNYLSEAKAYIIK